MTGNASTETSRIHTDKDNLVMQMTLITVEEKIKNIMSRESMTSNSQRAIRKSFVVPALNASLQMVVAWN